MIKTTNEGYLQLTGKQYMINEEGYYFDFIINVINQEYFTTIQNLEKDKLQLLTYPTYEELVDNLEKIINSNAVILLLPTQKKEITLLSTYFKKLETPFNITPLLDYLGQSDFSLEGLEDLAKNNLLYKIIYVFIKTKHAFNLNSSNLYQINENNCEQVFSKSDFKTIQKEQFPNAHKYFLKAQGKFSIDIFFTLLFHDMTSYRDEKTNYILKLIQFQDISRIDINKLDITQEIITRYQKEIAWKTKDNKLFMIGAIGN
jgi:hypothetical protein